MRPREGGRRGTVWFEYLAKAARGEHAGEDDVLFTLVVPHFLLKVVGGWVMVFGELLPGVGEEVVERDSNVAADEGELSAASGKRELVAALADVVALALGVGKLAR